MNLGNLDSLDGLVVIAAFIVLIAGTGVQIHQYAKAAGQLMDSALALVKKGETQVDKLEARIGRMEAELGIVKAQSIYLEEGVRILTRQLMLLGIQPDWTLPNRPAQQSDE